MKRFFALMGFLLAAARGLGASPGWTRADAPPPAAFNPDTAARAYLDRMTPDQRARSDAYFEGGYWLQLWQFLYGVAVAAILLQGRISARMRDWAERASRFRAVQSALYGGAYISVAAAMTLPLSFYADFVRERQYGLSNLSVGGWLGDWIKELVVGCIFGCPFIAALVAVVRWRPRTWHLWGSAVSVAFLIVSIVVGPVFVAPLFNQYTPLADSKVVEPVLRIARANGIAADKVYEMDASKQTTRVSANVSGLLGTMRITLNDNLLKRCSLAEIEAVAGHEIGHYVLNHVYKLTVDLGILVTIGFAGLRRTLISLIASVGPRWGIRGVDDLAAIPLAAALASAYAFLLTPIINTIIRTQEVEADQFGLNAARQPDGAAEAALKLGEYRKMEPTPIEEWLFFDHPSGASRIRTAMRWKAENLPRAADSGR